MHGMAGALIPKDRTVAALAEVWASIEELLGTLDLDQWSSPSPLAGWDVQANVAHMIGTESMLAGEPNPEVEVDRSENPHVRNDIGAFNEIWVQYLADKEPTEVLERFRDVTRRRIHALRAMEQVAWDAESFTPAGKDTYGRFMQIRVFDCWFHEQDIRDAVGVPGHRTGPAVEVALDEVSTALGFVVGKKAGASTGQSVTFDLVDPDGTSGRQVHVEVGERARVVPELSPGPDGTAPAVATTTIRLPLVPFTRLCGGRATADQYADLIELEGDLDLAQRVLANLAYTI
jgi:uncharacterized protein (TIGR03083 family)